MPRIRSFSKRFFSTFEGPRGRKAFCRKAIRATSNRMKAVTTDRRLTTSIVAGLVLVALIVHLLTIHRYGYFRDELYYIACARHLDFGYVDLAPLSAFLLRIELILFGSSLFALRIFPAVASALTIALTGMLTRELGGRAWAITLACTGMLGSLFFLAVGNFYSPNVFEPLFWTG